MSTYKENFIQKILSVSFSKEWKKAVQEWEIIDWEEDIEMDSSCICGKENIRYLYTIKNEINNEILVPIGSKCIEKFGRKDLKEITKEKETLFSLLKKVENNEFLTLKESGFTRKILKYFYEQDVFSVNKYNHYNSFKDYSFLLEMFNKKTSPTSGQERKIRGLIAYSIKPFLIKELAKKTNNK